MVLSGSSVLAADWPQWRGPDRSNVSTETGLAKEWPKDGPPLAWKATGLGDGVAPVSVAGGRLFTTGNVGADVVCTARSAKNGKEIWNVKLGPAAKESGVMRWLAQAAPTVDGDCVFAVTANGDYVCLAADTGKVIWAKHFITDFAGRKSGWGFCDYPLVEGRQGDAEPAGEVGGRLRSRHADGAEPAADGDRQSFDEGGGGPAGAQADGGPRGHEGERPRDERGEVGRGHRVAPGREGEASPCPL
jgi:hypothetical protein